MLVLLLVSCSEPEARNERSYQDEWCYARGGQTEVVLSDRSRIDCMTDEHAIEFDFARKYSEALGQSLHYARMTGLKAGIVLICETGLDKDKFQRLKDDIQFYGLDVTVWGVGCE
jgi:hypothetical protein